MEVPRARLTMELAKIKEANGEIAEAAAVLQELQVCYYYTMYPPRVYYYYTMYPTECIIHTIMNTLTPILYLKSRSIIVKACLHSGIYYIDLVTFSHPYYHTL